MILGTSSHNTHTTAESAAATVAGIPLGRGGNADDVARAAVFFAGGYDGFITGATLDINGGVTPPEQMASRGYEFTLLS